MKVDTTNRHLVTVHNGRIHIQLVPRDLAPAQAVELAAWLVAMADCARLDVPDDFAETGHAPDADFNADVHFVEALAAIRNT